MSTIKTFILKHSVLTYFALALAISWGGLLLVTSGPGGIPGRSEETESLLPLGYLTMLAGPFVAGILMTVLISGRAGFRELLSRLLKWRVGAVWYAVALLAAPLLAMVTLLALLPASPVFLPGIFATDDKASMLLTGLIVGLIVGIFEEVGWTGFAIPRLRQHHSILITGLMVGVVWGVWHLALFLWLSGDSSGSLSLPHFLPSVLFCLGILPVFRVLMVWVYDRTESLLVAILMHASITGGVALILMPLTILGVPNIIWYLVLAAALWIIVAVVQRRKSLHRG